MANRFAANVKAIQMLTRKQVRAVLTSRKTKIDPKSSLARVSQMLPSYSCIGSHLRPIALMNGRKHSSHFRPSRRQVIPIVSG